MSFLYEFFVCRGRRFAGIHFQNLFLKKNERATNGNKQFLTKFHYMAPQAKPL